MQSLAKEPNTPPYLKGSIPSFPITQHFKRQTVIFAYPLHSPSHATLSPIQLQANLIPNPTLPFFISLSLSPLSLINQPPSPHYTSPLPLLCNPMEMCSMPDHEHIFPRRCVWVNGPVIVGAGPSGLAVGACLKEQDVPFVILEKSDCIASLWQKRTYDRLKLHLPKQFCQLPNLPFPDHFPEYPSKKQFIEYLESYANKFEINPLFNECVQTAKYDETSGMWRVRTISTGGSSGHADVEYICRWLVVATGENAECVMPEVEGMSEFGSDVVHVCHYKSGEAYRGKRVLVVGCGNSGMEISLDLCNHNALPSMVVRNSVHVLPREVLGKSTFELAVLMMKWLPLWLVDKVMLILAWLVLGNTEKYGLKRPVMGPLHLKNTEGKTPVLDIGALQKIKSGDIKVVPGIKRLSRGRVELVNGENLEIDSVVLATGYRSNVPSWLKENDFFCKNGFPKTPFPNGWKGKAGLYAAGFTRRGLSGASFDAMQISQDIGKIWKEETKQEKSGEPFLCSAYANTEVNGGPHQHQKCFTHSLKK